MEPKPMLNPKPKPKPKPISTSPNTGPSQMEGGLERNTKPSKHGALSKGRGSRKEGLESGQSDNSNSSSTGREKNEGRLYQVEYAMEAISHAGTCLGILASDGILIAAEKRNVHKLLDDSILAEKIYRLSENTACTVAGITADANILINHLRYWAAEYKLNFGEHMPVEQLVQTLCNEKQRYTQVGGKRPFGVSLLYAGWDQHFGYQLYQSDPSGNYTGWKATCIGNNHQAAVSLLKQEYKSPTMLEAKKLAMKVLSKTLDVKLTAEKIEMALLTRRDGKTLVEELSNTEVTHLIKEHEEREKESETTAASSSVTST